MGKHIQLMTDIDNFLATSSNDFARSLPISILSLQSLSIKLKSSFLEVRDIGLMKLLASFSMRPGQC